MSENNSNVGKDKLAAGEKKGISFVSSLIAIVIDEAIVLVGCTALLFICDFIMQFLGYYVADKVSMLLTLL